MTHDFAKRKTTTSTRHPSHRWIWFTSCLTIGPFGAFLLYLISPAPKDITMSLETVSKSIELPGTEGERFAFFDLFRMPEVPVHENYGQNDN